MNTLFIATNSMFGRFDGPMLRCAFAIGFLILFAIDDNWLIAQDRPKRVESVALSFGKAEPAPDLNALFQPREGWIGGDGAFSIALSPRRTLWLFNDTWVGSVRNGKRVNATMVNNTLALQDGRDKDAKVQFIVCEDDNGKPAAFITPADKRGWYWPLAGAAKGDRLLFFLAQIEKSKSPGVFDFRQVGRWLGVVENPSDPPLSWRIAQRKVPCEIVSSRRELAFGAAVLHDGDYLYIYGTDEDKGPFGPARHLIVGRVPVDKAEDFAAWRFYRDGRWDADYHSASRLVGGMGSELSVSYLPDFKCYALVYTENGMSPRILARTAAAPWGPWSAATTIYQCPESGWDKKIFCYAAKAHPSLASGDELMVSYVANSFDIWQVAADARLYWPRFIRVPLRSQESVKAAR
jgi:hypothetical protein